MTLGCVSAWAAQAALDTSAFSLSNRCCATPWRFFGWRPPAIACSAFRTRYRTFRPKLRKSFNDVWLCSSTTLLYLFAATGLLEHVGVFIGIRCLNAATVGRRGLGL